MHVYSDYINKLGSLNQEDKEETGHGHSAQRGKKRGSGSAKCDQNSQTVFRTNIVKELEKLKLNTSGSIRVLQKRLDMYHSQTICCSSRDDQRKNVFDFYVVIDFEATCDGGQNIRSDNQEIIEFPAILINCKTGKIEYEFQSYCCTTLNPLLTDYCIKLTGIKQNVVDKAPSFREVFASFNDWLQKKELGTKFSFAIVTDGSKDMGHFLKTQCALSNILFPEYGNFWINIRKTFNKFYKIGDIQHRARMTNDTVLNAMIREIGHKFKGRAHSGLDDSRNIACIVQRLLEDGASIVFNEKLPDINVRKNVFSLPILESEFESIKDTLKSNFPTKHPTNAPIKNEIASKSCATGSSVMHEKIPKENTIDAATNEAQVTTSGKKRHMSGALSKIPIKEASSANILTKILTNDVPCKGEEKTPTVKRKSEVLKGQIQAMTADLTKKTSVKTSRKGTSARTDNTMTTLAKTRVGETPVKTLPKEASVKIPAKEISNRTNKKKTTAEAPVATTVRKVSAKPSFRSTSTKTEKKENQSIIALENPGKKTRKRRRVKSVPTQTSAVKGSDGNIIATISEAVNNQKTAEVLSKEWKLAKKKFYMSAQHARIPIKEFEVARKNIEILKKRLNAARSKEAPFVSLKPPVKATLSRKPKVTKEAEAVLASKQLACNSQSMAKKKVSSGKRGNQPENKGSLGTVALHADTTSVSTTASFCDTARRNFLRQCRRRAILSNFWKAGNE